MATYYVKKGGSDAAAGTSSALAWLTIGKALATAAAGDQVWIGAGVYREQASAGNSGTSGNPIVFSADLDGTHTGAPGEVRWTAYDNGDKLAPTGANPCLTINAKNYLTFSAITFQGALSNGTNCTGNPVGIIFNDCTWLPPTAFNLGLANVNVTGACSIYYNRCRFQGGHSGCGGATLGASGGSQYLADIQYNDCIFFSARNAINLVGGTGTGFGGGVVASRCTFHVGLSAMVSASGSFSALNQNSVNSSLIFAGTGLSAALSGQVIDGGNNVIYAQTALANVTIGSGTITDAHYAALVHSGQEYVQGRRTRHYLTPTVDSPLLGYYSGGAGLTDLLNRPRPAGGQSANLAVGALELHDQAVRETGTVPPGKSNAIRWTGPIDLQFKLPVQAVATQITIKVQWDGSYGAGTKPQLNLVDMAEIGVTGQSVAAIGSAGAWNTITLASFTPTGPGEIPLRLISNAAGAGVVYWGAVTISVAASTVDFDHYIHEVPVDYLVAGSGGGGVSGGVSRSRQFIGD
jgi:hypothetical protein